MPARHGRLGHAFCALTRPALSDLSAYESVMNEFAILAQALAQLGSEQSEHFAVLDGAKFADLAHDLMMGGFVSRSLYLDRGNNNPENQITAPRLVWLDEREVKIGGRGADEVSPALLNLIESSASDSAAAVFWHCAAGGEALFRHLRQLNMVLIPRTTPPSDAGEDPTHELVLFRHADANVLAQTLPALDPPCAARFFGPARAVGFAPSPEWRTDMAPVVLRRAPDWPRPVAGPLRLDEATIARMEALRENGALRDTRLYLREVLAPSFQAISDADLEVFARQSRDFGRDIGLITAAGHKRLAYLTVITGGQVLTDPRIVAFLRAEGQLPDDQVKRAMQDTLSHMKAVQQELAAETDEGMA